MSRWENQTDTAMLTRKIATNAAKRHSNRDVIDECNEREHAGPRAVQCNRIVRARS